MVSQLFKFVKIRGFALTALSSVIGAIIFFVVIGYSGVEDILAPFKKFSPLYFILFFVTSLLLILLSIWRWQLITKKMGYKVPFRSLFAYRNMGFVIGYLTPTARMGGDPLRAMLLTKEHNVPTTTAYSSVILDRVFDTSVGALVVTVSLLVSIFVFEIPAATKMIFLIISLLAAAFLIICYYRLIKREGFLSSVIRLLKLTKFRFFRKLNIKICEVERLASNFFYYTNKRYITLFVVISFLLWVFFIAEFKFALMTVGYNPGLLQVFLIIVFTGIISAIPVPASLGVLEAGEASALTILKAGSSLGVALALIIRARDLIWTFVGITLLSRKGLSMTAPFNHK